MVRGEIVKSLFDTDSVGYAVRKLFDLSILLGDFLQSLPSWVIAEFPS
jgi:hypothetical protein